MLKVDRLAVPGLPQLSFELAASECLAVEGRSGSGKTRLLRAIADLDPSGGYVFLEGAERAEVPGNQWRKRIRYVSAEPAWWTETVRACAASPAEVQKLERLARSLGLAPEALDRPVAQLSTGERLRLGLARACLDEPKVLLLDEPTAALDAEAGALVEELIRFQLLSGRAVILVAHDPGVIGRVAHRRLLLGAPAAPAAAPAAEPAPAATVDDRLATLAERWEAQR